SEGALADVRRLAGQASSVGEALAHVDQDRLAREEARLTQDLARASTDDVAAEVRRSLGSVHSQLEVRQRLEQAQAKLMARMESVVLGLESLVAKLVEVLTLVEAQSPVEGAQRIDEVKRQHELLSQQAAAVLGNRHQLELQLGRQIEDVERLKASAREALILEDQARQSRDTAKAASYEETAQAFASQLVSAEASMK